MRVFWLPAAFLAVLPAQASGHSRLTAPPSRSTADDLMAAPCGAVESGAERTVLEAGSEAVLEWALTQNHGSQFRIAFSAAADAGFDEGALGTRPDVVGEFEYVQEIQLPACTCDDCTIQLRQFSSPTMLEAYYSCSDIELVQPKGGVFGQCEALSGSSSSSGGDTGPGNDTTGADGTGTGTSTGSASDDSSGQPVTSTGSPPQTSTTSSGATGVAEQTGSAPGESGDAGGCRMSESRKPGPVLLWALLLAGAALRRRKRLRVGP